MNEELGALLGRWHYWRMGYSHERGLAQVHAFADDDDEDEDLDRLQMQALEREIASMPRLHQLALQHVARYEYLGVECLRVGALPANNRARAELCELAQRSLRSRLLALGLL